MPGTMRGILAYGAYLPYYRLQRSAITAALASGGGRGTRSVASYDEDATSMAVEASRRLMRSAPEGLVPDAVYLATSTPPYLDKTNATVIHAALDLPSRVFAGDVGGSPRSVNAALRSALDGTRPTLVVSADIRSGRPGSADEANLGDAAVAWLIGSDDDGPVLAEWLGGASATEEFLDRWRLPEWNYSRVWEERFGEHAYLPLVTEAAGAAFKECQIEPTDVDAVVIAGLHARAVRGAARAAGVDGANVVGDLTATVGQTGGPHAGLVLASVLDRAEPGQTIMVIHMADGVDVGFYRTTEAIAAHQPASTVADQIEAGNDSLDYNTFLTWRGFLDRETAPSSRSGAAGRPTIVPVRSLEVRLRRIEGRLDRGHPPAPAAGVGQGRSGRRDGTGPHGRRPGHRGDLHHRPAGLLAVAAGHRRGHRLRRWRPVPVPADRRRPGRRQDR